MTATLDLVEIIERNESIVSGKRTLFVRLNRKKYSERLLIVMSAHNHGEKYMALRSFLEKQTCDLLFITDPKNSWYLDEDNGESFERVIYNYSKNYDNKNVFLFGSSMSGYGAILHALKLNLNAIASNPQINLNITKDYAWPELIEHINDLNGNHINIEKIAGAIWKDSAIYIIHGHDDIDTINANLLINTKPDNKKLIIQTVDVDSHVLYFGKNIEYVYDVMELLSIFRKNLDLSSTVESLTAEAKNTKKSLRSERNLLSIDDPFRSLTPPKKGILWQDRYNHEAAGSNILFGNIGFYHNNTLSGAICYFDGEKWRLTSLPYNASDNLISCNDFATNGNFNASNNNSFFNDYWWIRNELASPVTINGNHNFCEIHISEARNKNIYINSSIPESVETKNIRGQFLTFTADVFTTDGEISLTLGGVGDSGYHHKNSDKSSAGKWKRLVVFEQFTSVNHNHKDRIFVRFNLAADGKSKVVQIKNACLTIGYFPMGFSE
ncbi:hypothetical protein [Pseudomonas sp. Irchel s3b6]|uniref:hypothetical protein n=1 Tax=Pseudomonas sp. Irchel s3b6 TaxID=2009078 RepID=UPI000BA3DE8E|nr:hypothetical protein [Pseudomonas sp. Irchel s3b6]